jgi:hypothetical protein
MYTVHMTSHGRHLYSLNDVLVILMVKSTFLVEVSLLLISYFFYFLFSLLKITGWSFLLLIFQFWSLFFPYLILFFNQFVKVLFAFNLVLQFQFIIYYFFQFDPCYLISKFFHCPVCESFIIFYFHHSIQFYGVLYF